ncbi:MAG: hypothetical protein IJN90_02050 [Bacilli bacterium]|nr:hypothetical protein [Bacilli bacterium]
MNREFVYLNNEKVAVTDENGKITVRDAELGMRDVLVNEDKIEDLDSNISRLRESIKIENTSIKLINKWYKVMAGISAVIVIGAPIGLGIINGLGLIGAWAVAATAACGYGLYTQRDSHKRINGYRKEIQKSKQLKASCEKELELSREYNKDYKVPSSLVGSVVEIDSMKDFERQDASLHRAFRIGYREEPKILVKTMKPKNSLKYNHK